MREGDNVTVTLMVSVEQAAEWLRKSTLPRSKGVVEEYTRQMRAGAWVYDTLRANRRRRRMVEVSTRKYRARRRR